MKKPIKLLMTSTQKFSDEKMKAIEDLGYAVDLVPDREPMDPEKIPEYEVVVCHSLFKFNDLHAFTNLKFVHSYATGVEALPLEELAKTDLMVSKGKALFCIPMSEWAVCKLLSVYKQSRKFNRQQREHAWQKPTIANGDVLMDELCGKKVAILGAGDIAGTLTEILRGFDVHSVVGMNSDGRPVEGYDAMYAPDRLEELLTDRDIVVILAPLTEKTNGLFDDRVIGMMKQGSILCNLSRGKLVQNDAVVRALDSGHLFHFIGDVFENEPLPAESPLWQREDITITPHNSFITNMWNPRLYDLIFNNLKLYAEGKEPGCRVDLTKGY